MSLPRQYLFASDFDKTLTLDDSGAILSAMLGITGFPQKVAVLDRLQAELAVSNDRIIYVGDGSSDVHVMLHVNQRNGYTIAVSEAKSVAQIARRTVLGDDAQGVVVPILEDLFQWDAPQIRALFESRDLQIQQWAKVHTDWITISGAAEPRLPSEPARRD